MGEQEMMWREESKVGGGEKRDVLVRMGGQ